MQELFFSLEGRIGRGKWWLGILLLFIAQLVVFGTLAFFGLYSIDPAQEMTLSAALVQLAVSIVFIWMSVCLGGKRYHDRDKSAWWMLIVLIPIIGWLWQIIELGLLKGTEGPNRFGPDPVG
jgi:uncharacterized membrane protein YhaH (DUF805 family)